MRISDWSSDVCSSDLDTDNHIFWVVLVGERIGMVGVVEDQALAIVQFSEKFVGAPASLVIVEATVSVNLIAIHGLIWPDTDGRRRDIPLLAVGTTVEEIRSEEHTTELQSLMRISYAVFC